MVNIRNNELRDNNSDGNRFENNEPTLLTPFEPGEMTGVCQWCGARYWEEELPFDGIYKLCCKKGRIDLLREIEYPLFLKDLLTNSENPNFLHFQSLVQRYNGAFRFAAISANVEENRGQSYFFRMNGAMYHITRSVSAVGTRPALNQIYQFSRDDAINFRQGSVSGRQNLKREILIEIENFIRENNAYYETYKTMQEMANEDPSRVQELAVLFKDRRGMDAGRYNAPTANEVGIIFNLNEFNAPPKWNLVVKYRNERDNQAIFFHDNVTENHDPMCYPIFFPYGHQGWTENILLTEPIGSVTHVSLNDYKRFYYHIRENVFNPFHHAGNLFQQYTVDAYVQVESRKIDFLRKQQPHMRVVDSPELRSRLAQGEDPNHLGFRFKLPTDFIGSDGYLREKFHDCMAIVGHYGMPDLFITYTMDPYADEISRHLNNNQHYLGRQDLVTRSFNMRVKHFEKVVLKEFIIGDVLYWTKNTEFQKRGLAHFHMLLKFKERSRLRTFESIDSIVSAEIPDPNEEPELFRLVIKNQIHGPCNANCLVNGVCKKRFPKPFNENTYIVNGEYPVYRRRNRPITFEGRVYNNDYVVPYNKKLTKIFKSHINVEVATQLTTVKYVNKYSFKGGDRSDLEIVSGEDAIAEYRDGRYVSSAEAMYRSFGFTLAATSISVIGLDVHTNTFCRNYLVLPRRNVRRIEEEIEEEMSLEEEFRELPEPSQEDIAQHGPFEILPAKRSKLEAFFLLNSEDEEARNLLYREVPQKYKWNNRERRWDRRVRRSKQIGRLYPVNPRDIEKYCAMIILQSIRGPKSWVEVMTVNGILYCTLKDTAEALGLLNIEDYARRALREASFLQMPRQIRSLYVFLVDNDRTLNSNALFEEFLEKLGEDKGRRLDRRAFVLRELNYLFLERDLEIRDFIYIEESFNFRDTEIIEENNDPVDVSSLNPSQRATFHRIKAVVLGRSTESDKIFYIDGPGGTGKTYMMNLLIRTLNSLGKVCLVTAPTGLAASLLVNGTTLHSTFNIPFNLNESSQIRIPLESRKARFHSRIDVLFIDEISMVNAKILDMIDQYFRDLMNNEQLFGGKVVVFLGDLRQLPVVVSRYSSLSISASLFTNSIYFREAKRRRLRINMRAQDQPEFNRFLMRVGNGAKTRNAKFPEGVYVPEEYISTNLIEDIFDNINDLTIEDIERRQIIAGSNKEVDQFNLSVLNKFDGNVITLKGQNTLLTGNESIRENYTPEILKSLNLPGLPYTEIKVKKNCILNITRNIDQRNGIVNGTRVMLLEVFEFIIQVKVLTGKSSGNIMFIPQIDFTSDSVEMPFVIKRRQFPIRLGYASTIHKCQGQSFNYVGVSLENPVFSHGQLYVAFSRAKFGTNLKVYIQSGREQGVYKNKSYAKNIVDRNILPENH